MTGCNGGLTLRYHRLMGHAEIHKSSLHRCCGIVTQFFSSPSLTSFLGESPSVYITPLASCGLAGYCGRLSNDNLIDHKPQDSYQISAAKQNLCYC